MYYLWFINKQKKQYPPPTHPAATCGPAPTDAMIHQTPAAAPSSFRVGGLYGCPTLRLSVDGRRSDVVLTQELPNGDYAGHRTTYFGGGAVLVPRAALVAEGLLAAQPTTTDCPSCASGVSAYCGKCRGFGWLVLRNGSYYDAPRG